MRSRRLMGIETEYALVVRGADGGPSGRDKIARRLMRVAGRMYPHLSDGGGGLFLGNGSRLYIDHGLHPELATPECSDPWELVRYVDAGHQILASLLDELRSQHPELHVHLFRSNVDYTGTRSTWGCHESYMHAANPRNLPRELVPHLVTRIVYSGSGGFDPTTARPRFALSPRSYYMEKVNSSNSTHRRGVFHTKNEPLAGNGYHRLHIVFGESTCSETATLLKTGVTALIVALVEGGIRPSDGLSLPRTLERLRTIAADPSCTQPVAEVDGERGTAIDVQRHYLECVRMHLDCDFVPSWAEEICALWEATLDRLEAGAPESVAPTLDWAMKHAVFAGYFERRGWEKEALEVLSRVAGWLPASVLTLSSEVGPRGGDRIPADAEKIEMATRHLADQDLSLSDFDRYLADRNRLYEADVRWGEIGNDSIFARLDREGRLDHAVSGVGDVLAARHEPPGAGRARVRGEVIRRISGRKGALCDWETIVAGRKRLDLSDPLIESEGDWMEIPKGKEGDGDARVDTLLGRLTALID